MQERKKQGHKVEFGGFNVDLIEIRESFKESIFWVFLLATDSVLLGVRVSRRLLSLFKGKSENTVIEKRKRRPFFGSVSCCC